MEYVKCGSLSVFVRDKGKRISLDERLQLYKKFALDIAEVIKNFFLLVTPVVVSLTSVSFSLLSCRVWCSYIPCLMVSYIEIWLLGMC